MLTSSPAVLTTLAFAVWSSRNNLTAGERRNAEQALLEAAVAIGDDVADAVAAALGIEETDGNYLQGNRGGK